jgi:hypothetical protein
MQRKLPTALVAVFAFAGTSGAFAQGYGRYDYGGPQYGPAYGAPAAPPMYGPRYVPTARYYRGAAPAPWWGTGFNGTNHPTPSSSQGDVGPGGNNNGTLTGFYRGW